MLGRARGRADRRRRLRRRARGVHGRRDPERLELVAAYTPDGLARHGPHRLLAPAQPGAAPPAPATSCRPPRVGGQARAARARRSARRAARARRRRRRRDAWAARSSGVERCAAAARAACRRASWPSRASSTSCRSAATPRRSARRRASSTATRSPAYAALCSEHKEYRDHGMLRALLELYGERYGQGKRARSALDFEDLELLARDLLARRTTGLRQQYAERFAHVLVDEFQDTNPLQNELLEQLDRDNLFRVGDENQSIYGFRNADVEVFRAPLGGGRRRRPRREHHRQLPQPRRGARGDRPLLQPASGRTASSRSSEAPGARAGRRGVEPVRGAARDRPRQAPLGRGARRARTRSAPAMHAATPWRAAEARLLAKRVRRAARAGRLGVARHRAAVPRHHPHGLLRAGARGARHPDPRRRRPRLLGAAAGGATCATGWPRSPTRSTSWRVYSVLASPLAGLSLDARGADRDGGRAQRGATPGGCCSTPDELDDLLPGRRTAAAPRPSSSCSRPSARTAPQVSLETLIDRAVTAHRLRPPHPRARAAARRRMANVRKLMRMAREFEADEGRDLRGFIDTLAERDEVQSREGEAPLEAEALDAVRLMTVHRAKGLEFPVVCVADLGKDGREDYGRLRISDDGMTGLRLASLGGGVARQRPARRDQGAPEGARRAGGAAHLLRRGHARAGAPRAERRDRPREAPGARGHARADALAACAASPGPGVARHRAHARRTWTSCCRRPTASPARPEPRAGRRRRPAGARPGHAAGAARAAGQPALLQRARGLPALLLPLLPGAGAAAAAGGVAVRARRRCPTAGLGALLRGTLVHELLERLDFERPAVPERGGGRGADRGARRHRARRRRSPTCATWSSASPARSCARASRGRSGCAPSCRSPSRSRRPGAGGRSLLVNGVVDVHAAEADGLLVVDYKSDAARGPRARPS